MEKQRLDTLLKQIGAFESREKAQTAIKQGLVKIKGEICTSPSKKYDTLALSDVEINQLATKYVSRGAYKLEKAINEFQIVVKDKVATDIGASTGGFSDVLLQNQAEKVYAIDVGSSQLHNKIKNNPKVVSMEETDFRTITLDQISKTELVVIDVSFISILPIIHKLKQLFEGKNVEIVSLIKPQFECGKDIARKYHGVIKDKKIHKQIITSALGFWNSNGFKIAGITPSPIKGGDGNVEYLLYTKTFGKEIPLSKSDIENIIENAFKK